jgi:hypothetical protein
MGREPAGHLACKGVSKYILLRNHHGSCSSLESLRGIITSAGARATPRSAEQQDQVMGMYSTARYDCLLRVGMNRQIFSIMTPSEV